MSLRIGGGSEIVENLKITTKQIKSLSSVFAKYNPFGQQAREKQLNTSLQDLSSLLSAAKQIQDPKELQKIAALAKQALPSVETRSPSKTEEKESLLSATGPSIQERISIAEKEIRYIESLAKILNKKQNLKLPEIMRELCSNFHHTSIEEKKATAFVINQILQEITPTLEATDQLNLLQEASNMLISYATIEETFEPFFSENRLTDKDISTLLQGLTEIQNLLIKAKTIPNSELQGTVSLAVNFVMQKAQPLIEQQVPQHQPIQLAMQKIQSEQYLLDVSYDFLCATNSLKISQSPSNINTLLEHTEKAFLSEDINHKSTVLIELQKIAPLFPTSSKEYNIFSTCKENLQVNRAITINRQNVEQIAKEAPLTHANTEKMKEAISLLQQEIGSHRHDLYREEIIESMKKLFPAIIRPLATNNSLLEKASEELHKTLSQLGSFDRPIPVDSMKILGCSNPPCSAKNFRDPNFSIELSIGGRNIFLQGRSDPLTNKPLATGGFGRIVFGEDPLTGDKIAVKLCFFNPANFKQCDDIEREISTLLMVQSSANLLGASCVGVHHDNSHSALMIAIMPEIQGGTLPKDPPLFSRDDQIQFFKKMENVVSGLVALHQKNIIHRDIKENNIMIDSNTGLALILDFGLSVPDSRVRTQAGTPNYMSPEAILGNIQTTKSDIYSFGIMLHRQVFGSTPFPVQEANGTPNQSNIQHRTRSDIPILVSRLHHFSPDVRSALKELLTACLKCQPSHRIDASNLLQKIQNIQALI